MGVALTVRFLMTFGSAGLYNPDDPKGRSREEIVGPHNTRRLSALDSRLQQRGPHDTPRVAAAVLASGATTAEIARTRHGADVSIRR
ncbi:MAG: hypothetical protein AAFQ50_06830 [Pseudomonadota bacterium]